MLNDSVYSGITRYREIDKRTVTQEETIKNEHVPVISGTMSYDRGICATGCTPTLDQLLNIKNNIKYLPSELLGIYMGY